LAIAAKDRHHRRIAKPYERTVSGLQSRATTLSGSHRWFAVSPASGSEVTRHGNAVLAISSPNIGNTKLPTSRTRVG